MTTFRHLFTPLNLGSRTVKNRIVSTPHATRYDVGGVISSSYVDYNARKAAGGLGLLMPFGSASVHPTSSPSYGAVALWNARNELPLTEIADRVRPTGALLISQATHLGRRSNSRKSGQVVRAPSDVPEGVNREISHVMTTADVRAIVRAFASAAKRLERCGWDGIEISSFGGHLIEQFWSPRVNTRADRYGGTFEKRMQFVREVIEAVAEAVSDTFLVGMRLTADPMTPDLGLTREAMLEIAAGIDAIGRVDLFSISGGTGATAEAQEASVPTDAFPRGVFNEVAGAMRRTLGVPVLVAGRILTAAEGEAALERGDCDLVGMTRALIADPDLPAKAQAGKAARVRPCVALNQECIGRVNLGMPMRCAVNPQPAPAPTAAGRSASIDRVVVIGGGPAGLEAARCAAAAGHDVTLVERSERLGGELLLAVSVGDHPDVEPYLTWLVDELERHSVTVQLGQATAPAQILSLSPTRVVVATGATSFVPPGAAALGCATVTDVAALRDPAVLAGADNVLVYDRNGGFRGASAAFAAAAQGCTVTLAAPLVSVVDDIEPWLRPSLLQRLAALEVVNLPDLNWVESDGSGAFVHRWSGRPYEHTPFDLVVFTSFRQADDSLGRALMAADPDLQVDLVGDCLSPRRLYEAVLEGSAAGAGVAA
ncbi:MAG: dimethylglycine catabolism [Gaiellales bacterium]|nr:dimethylglycine catabolism [Gaiellales bacterium]